MVLGLETQSGCLQYQQHTTGCARLDLVCARPRVGSSRKRISGLVYEHRKSHFSEALGHLAIEDGKSVAWFSVEDLGVLVRRHRIDDSVAKAMATLAAIDLVIVDDIGLLAISPDASEGLYRLIDQAYERRSIVVSSNLHPSAFDQIMDKHLAAALTDRLLHHAHIVITEGESIRLTEAIKGKGVMPLPLR